MDDEELMDVGAQAERTALAWQRTGIGAIAVGLLWLRGSVHQHLLSPWPGLLLTAAATLAVLLCVPQRYRRVLHNVRTQRTPLSRGMVPGTALVLAIVTIAIGIDLLRT
ncbi:hypothetical protein TUM20985_08630 [Mycobacterium antarcticum]|uniref:DUF202 domain-containing protein n=1 Tax=unclassified Mycolicibacterium TaxID=2636767 RepID=UPI0023851D5B|nr:MULTISPECIES: DUF202 domain-containing protein [unclassified Mycolicibacterium]BDX30316.1 hypothetical protein TUM20985_08630 [Mycolicibacterium sp. TUM20985]GLP73756.1 hypothetical protein TUM20983_08660 [Mycolicibacterium sp. TUM20983]